eukprot:CAMPEP_0168230586 /NCGR_PEP_ID=MMETSP0140_2-20121125/16073_1 /TAXON_ID=44445 /ORGANISM="Pseudo-nitzschia australis, Strain 10249 10 AB" /LENGTH=348 /DNA_ID=CAMNT_0008162845 /DNA_START=733 /DNA_END=1775 /DNA_ORIENTATION=-
MVTRIQGQEAMNTTSTARSMARSNTVRRSMARSNTVRRSSIVLPTTRTRTTSFFFLLLVVTMMMIRVSSGSESQNINENSSSSSNNNNNEITHVFSPDTSCKTGDPLPVVLDKRTGRYTLLHQHERKNEHERKSGNHRRYLRTRTDRSGVGASSASLGAVVATNNNNGAIAIAIAATDTAHTHRHRHRLLSTDGSNRLATEHGHQGTADVDAGDYSTPEPHLLRACPCGAADRGTLVLCPESSDWCATTTGDGARARCFAMDRSESFAENAWPMLWIMYAAVLLSFCCSFHGRIVLDFVRGTLLYYVCGCGDKHRDRGTRSIARYNQGVVDQILSEEYGGGGGGVNAV